MEVSHLTVDLPGYPGSYGLISQDESADCAAIFVHGFGGDAEMTWFNFQGLLDLEKHREHWSKYDLFFWQYQSLWDHIEASSDRLRHLMEDLYPIPNPQLFEIELGTLELSALPTDRRYSKLMLVGHSEGAVIIRHMLLRLKERSQAAAGVGGGDRQMVYEITAEGPEAGSNAKTNMPVGKLRLFAPALFGYRPSGFLGLIANSAFLGTFVDWIFSSTSPPYQDFREPAGLLAELRKETESVATHHSILRARILWGGEERIVKPGQYRDDVIHDFIEGGTHTSICKPSPTFLVPLEFCEQ